MSGADTKKKLVGRHKRVAFMDVAGDGKAYTRTGQRHGASIELKSNGQIYFVAGDSFIEAGFTVSYPL